MTRHTAEGTASLRRQARGALVAAVFLCLMGSAAANAVGLKEIDVDISPGHTEATNVGCGFGLITEWMVLGVDLYWPLSPIPIPVNASGMLRPCNPDNMWVQTSNYQWWCVGVEPFEECWVVLWGVKGGGRPGGGGGRRMEGWMSVSDCDLDADTDNLNSVGWPREPDRTDEEDHDEYYDTSLPPSTVSGIVLGVNDDHDEFLPGADPWGRDLDNDTADLGEDGEGTHYDGHSVGLAKLQLTVNAKRDGQLDFDFFAPRIRLFESDGSAFQGARNLGMGKHELTFWMECIEEDNYSPAVTVTFDPVGSPGVAEDAVTVTPVKMDIDVDSDNNGTIVDDNSQAEDLNEAKPGEPGMIVSLTEDPEEPPEGDPNGVLRGLYSMTISDVLNPHDPVVTLKKVSGEGDVQVWKVRDGQDPVLMLDTSEEASTTTDGEDGSLWDLLKDCSDHEVIITGVDDGEVGVGEVQLGLELTVNGAKVAMDVVNITVLIDLDVDSDNQNGLERSKEEDQIEDDPELPGKYVGVNDDDDDNDGIPDFADGYDIFDTTEGTTDEAFTLMKLELAASVDRDVAKLKFSYDASDPAGVQRTGTPPDYVYTPADGKLRVWTEDGTVFRHKASIAADADGDFVPGDETEIPASRFTWDSGNVTDLYIEGIHPSEALGDARIVVWVDPDGDGPMGFIADDAVRLTIVKVDLDVDSDNNNALNAPDRNLVEDHYENVKDDPTRPGKLIGVNDSDNDGDDIPDFADGFGLDPARPEDDVGTVGDLFTPLVVELPALLDPADVQIEVIYNASDPGAMVVPAPGDPYEPAAGFLRIWTKSADEARDPNPVNEGGDFVGSGTQYNAADLGFGPAERTVTFYIEGIAASSVVGDQAIAFRLYVDLPTCPVDNAVCQDMVRATVIDADYLDAQGDVIDGVPTVEAQLLNEYVAGGSGGVAGFLTAPAFQRNRYRFEIAFSGPLDPEAVDTIQVNIIDAHCGAPRVHDFKEDGPDTCRFRDTDDFTYNWCEPPLLTMLDYPGGDDLPNTLRIDYDTKTDVGILSGICLERVGSTAVLAQPAVILDCSVLPPNGSGLRSLRVDLLSKNGQSSDPATLVETAPDSCVFGSSPDYNARIAQSTGLSDASVDSIEFEINNTCLALVAVRVDTVETAPDSRRFVTPAPGFGGFMPGGDPTPAFPDEAVFSLRVHNAAQDADQYDVILFGDAGLGYKKCLAKITVTRQAPGLYESRPILAVREYETLDPDVFDQLGETYEIIPGEGSPLTGAVVVIGAAAGYLVINVGDAIVDDIFMAMVDAWDGKDVNTRIFRILDSGGLTFGTDWDDLEDLAESKGWTDSDENQYAEEAEILDDIRDMDADDIFVFHGHTAGVVDANDRVVSVNGLTGYDTLGFRDLIDTGELAVFMADQGPGVVIISGCAGWFNPLKQTFIDKGTKLYIAWTDSINSLEGALTFGPTLVKDLLDGVKVDAALNKVNTDPVIVQANQRREIFGFPILEMKAYVAKGGAHQTIYEILDIEEPD